MELSSNGASEFLELSSEQRLAILQKLYQSKSKVSVVAKELGATVPEVFRNFERLARADMISKDADGYYSLTTYGKTICSQMPSLLFVSGLKKYFKTHDFGDMPEKFIQRIGALAQGQHYKGFTRVLEQWRQICDNSEKYIFDILSEEPRDLMEPIITKAKSGIKINSIFSVLTVTPNDRKEVIEKLGVKQLVSEGAIERRILQKVGVVVILNEKEACVMFPKTDGETDMSETFYSNDPLFHEWCLDYFRYCWYGAEPFSEGKLAKGLL
ncbi:MAG: transcriptional regulator [Thaumarchaeota archaeon]|nr:transcriptional regulator [Nitrososphaerota archaeon]